MPFFDILRLALRNLREAKLRASLTTIGVIIGVAVIVTMVSFGLGLQRNTVDRFRELDLFNEVTVYGRNITTLLNSQMNKGEDEKPPEEEDDNHRGPSKRALDDAALDEIAQIPGVAYVEPNLTFRAFVRANGKTLQQSIGAARVPNAASRFQKFSAGTMLSSKEADEVVVDSEFLKHFDYENPSDAVGQTLDLLAPPESSGSDAEGGGSSEEEDDSMSFLGIPLEGPEEKGSEAGEKADGVERLVARSFRIVGVLQDEVAANEGGPDGNRRMRGIMPESNIYMPLPFAVQWKSRNRDELSEVALQLARVTGVVGENETEGYASATVRVDDPAAVSQVINQLKEKGFNAFGLMNELDEIRTVFLIINSALGLLGGISLLVASFGIANTMIMSIFERTREIGIMKAIGADDRDVKFIFFFEAAVIGFLGGTIGALAAWGIDRLANQLVYAFLLKPRGASFIDFFSIPPWLWLGAILFAIVVAVLAALYPAARAARIDPVKALRHD